MKIVSWNVAGIRARIKNNQLQKFIDENEFDILCIQETKSTI
jgi:exonuclease III